MLLGRISSEEEEDILGKKINILNNGCGEENQVEGNFIHPCENIHISLTFVAEPPYPPPSAAGPPLQPAEDTRQ